MACTLAYFRDSWDLTISVVEKARGAYAFTLDGTELVDGGERILPFWHGEREYATVEESRSAAKELLAAIRSGRAKIKRFALGRRRGYGLRLIIPDGPEGAPAAKSTDVVATLAERAEIEAGLSAYHAALAPDCVGMRLSLQPKSRDTTSPCPDPTGKFGCAPPPAIRMRRSPGWPVWNCWPPPAGLRPTSIRKQRGDTVST